MKVGGVILEWLGHASFMIKGENKIIYIDLYQINSDKLEKADLILITHSHPDHCSVADIDKIIKPNTRIVMTADCQSKIVRTQVPIKMEVIEPGQEFDFGNVRISAVPAYNIDKSFHPKDEGWVGYVVKLNGVIIYHSGDTDVIPEMQKLTGHKKSGTEFIALIPVGGKYTMNAEEALEAVKMIKPTLAIPMHWGGLIGSREDAEQFVELCEEEDINAKIIEVFS